MANSVPASHFIRQRKRPANPFRAALGVAIALTTASLLLGQPAVSAESPVTPRGFPPMRTYSFEEIGSSTAGVRLGCDDLGRLTVYQPGTYRVFDDRSWADVLSAPESRYVNACAIERAPDGTTFWSSAGSWGYFERLDDGAAKPHWLRPKECPGWVLNTSFHTIAFVGQRVFIAGSEGLIDHDRDTRQTRFVAVPNLSAMFALNGAIFVSSRSHPLQRLDPAGLVPVVDRLLTGGTIIEGTARWDNRHELVYLPAIGLALFDGTTMQPWQTEIDDMLLSRAVVLRTLDERCIAVSIMGRGVHLLDRQGKILRSIDDPIHAEVTDMMCTEPGVLWLSTQTGLTKLLYRSPIEIFDHRSGMEIGWPKVINHRGRLLVVTMGRLYEPAPSLPGRPTPFVPSSIRPNDGITVALSTPHGLLLTVGDSLFEAGDDGVSRKVLTLPGAHDLHLAAADQSGDTGILISDTVIAAVRWNGAAWEECVPRIAGIGTPSNIQSAVPNSQWIELGVGRVGRVRFRDDQLTTEVFRVRGPSTQTWPGIGRIGNVIVIGQDPDCRLYFDETTDSFRTRPELGRMLDAPRYPVLRPIGTEEGEIWAAHHHGIFRLLPDGPGKHREEIDSVATLRDYFPILQRLANGEIWTSSQHLLHWVHFTPDSIVPRTPHPVLTRVVDTLRKTPFYDAFVPDKSRLDGIPFRSNSLAFQFFPGTQALLRNFSYQYKLDGYSEDWSDPVNSDTITFTNLHEGSYRLVVRVFDESGPVGRESSYLFSIAPPWYRAWFACVSYVVLGTAVVGFTGRGIARRSRSRREELEALVQARTRELDIASERLKASVTTAEQATRAKSQFLAHMSHEIRTPMNGVVGMVCELEATKLDSDQREICRVIQSSTESLLTIINDILDFSKIEQGKLQINTTPVDLGQLCHDVIALFSPQAREKGLSMTVSVLGLDDVVMADSVRLRQILCNLVGNAVKFTASGNITVWAWQKTPGSFRFEVSDTGIGIAPADQGRLFQAFEQIDESQTRKFGGTGLGLAISRHLVELMNGRIGVISTPGVGTTFWFEVPLNVAPEGVRPAQLEPAQPTTAFRQLSILIVDDNPTNRLVAERAVTRLGHIAHQVGDGIDALSWLAANTCDVVFMDCQMPRLDGYEATQRIRSGSIAGIDSRVPIVGLTAFALPAETQRGLSMGMDAYVAKPFRPDEIERVLARLGLSAARPQPREDQPPADDPSPGTDTFFDPKHVAFLSTSKAPDGSPLGATLYRTFMAQVDPALDGISQAINAGDMAELANRVHRFGGSAAGLGATSLRTAAVDLEQLARKNAVDSLPAAYARLQAACTQVREHPEPWIPPPDEGRPANPEA